MHVLQDLLRVLPSSVNLALVCDREQDLAKQIAAWLQRDRDKAKSAGIESVDDLGFGFERREQGLQPCSQLRVARHEFSAVLLGKVAEPT